MCYRCVKSDIYDRFQTVFRIKKWILHAALSQGYVRSLTAGETADILLDYALCLILIKRIGLSDSKMFTIDFG